MSLYDGETFTTFTSQDGLASDPVFALLQAADGILWVGTYDGGVSPYDGVTFSTLDTRDGLAGNRVSAIIQEQDGSLLFGTSGGVSRYRRSAIQPRVRILAVRTDTLYQGGKGAPPITAGLRVTIEYRAIDFKTLPAKRLYRRRIEELDPNWSKSTRSTQFEWTPRQAGAYTFAVQAIDRDLNYSSQALAVLAREQFDLVLMDVQMPEMDGLEATAAIRAREAQTGGGRLPIIGLTAHSRKGDQERCLAAGMDGYLSKPIRSEQLFATLARVEGTAGGGGPPCPGSTGNGWWSSWRATRS